MNIVGGLRGGHFRHANDVHLLGFGLEILKKKKSLFEGALFLTTSHLVVVVWVIISTTDCNPQHRVTSSATAFGPPNFQMEITPLLPTSNELSSRAIRSICRATRTAPEGDTHVLYLCWHVNHAGTHGRHGNHKHIQEENSACYFRVQREIAKCRKLTAVTTNFRGVIPGGAGGGGAVAPPTFGQQHFFRGFHTPLTETKVPSEVVLMGSFMSVIIW